MSTSILTNNQLLLINAALMAFENPIPKIVDGKEQRQPYDIGEKAKYAIMRNLSRLKPHMAALSDEREALRIVFNPRSLKAVELPEDKQVGWDQAHRSLMAEGREGIVFHRVKLSEFNVLKNTTMPYSIIAELIGNVIEDDLPQDGTPA